MTTNHIQNIHKGMLRPGRLDAVVHIGELDRNGVERLIKAVVPWTKLEDTIDYDVVYEHMEKFLPAFVRESVTRAVTFAITRLDGKRDYTIGTEDLCNAADSLRPQLAHLDNAGEGKAAPTLDLAMGEIVSRSVIGLGTADSHHEHYPIVELDDEGQPVEK
jgi:transitional endoplasmic reticulum ATPase